MSPEALREATLLSHTPGPWRLGRPSGTVVAPTTGGHAGDQPELDFYGGHLVAESIGTGANACLIAAAPDLLLCLKVFVQAESNPRVMETEAYRAAVAAIEKAEGTR